jgi:TPR repeat protein
MLSISSEDLLEIAEYYKTHGDHKNAEKYYLRLIDHKDPEAMYKLGLIYEQSFLDHKKAKYYYLMASELDHTTATYTLGNIYYNEGSLEQAESCYLKIIEKINKSDDSADNVSELSIEDLGNIMNMLGLIYDTKGDFERAEEYFKKAIDYDFWLAYYNLGAMYFQEYKDYSEALYYFEMYNTHGSNDPEYSDYFEDLVFFLKTCRKCLNDPEGHNNPDGHRKSLDQINTDLDSECCLCWKPLMGTSSGINILVCGHAYHTNCLYQKDHQKDQDVIVECRTCECNPMLH